MAESIKNAKSSVSQTSNELQKKLPQLNTQIQKIQSVQSNIQSIMTGTRSNSYNNVMIALSDAIKKANEAESRIMAAKSTLDQWVEKA